MHWPQGRCRILLAGGALGMAVVLGAVPEVVSVRGDRAIVRDNGVLRSVAWADLPPGVQAAWTERREAAAREEAARAERAAAAEARMQEQRAAVREAERARVDRAAERFGQPAQWRQGGVDLRPRFRDLDLWVKTQGRRPSCSVFAVVGALEFQLAEALGRPVRLSEEYLLWATRRTLGLDRYEQAPGTEAGDRDEGFALLEVVQALRTWGIPPAERVPNLVVGNLSRQTEPPAEIVAEARSGFSVGAYLVPGRTVDDTIANVTHLLNAGQPVVIGMRWPSERALRRGVLLRRQRPREDYSHAVTLVGYRLGEQSGEIEYIFRNSWGPEWGAGGYGYVALSYLKENFLGAVFLEVEIPSRGG